MPKIPIMSPKFGVEFAHPKMPKRTPNKVIDPASARSVKNWPAVRTLPNYLDLTDYEIIAIEGDFHPVSLKMFSDRKAIAT